MKKGLRARDGRRLRFDPMQEAELVFAAPEPVSGRMHWGSVLRMTGYYEFLP